MLYKDKEIPELYHLKHLHDNKKRLEHEEKFMKKSISPILFTNPKMRGFLEYIQSMLSLKFDMFNIVKNWKNYIVDKYEYRHNN